MNAGENETQDFFEGLDSFFGVVTDVLPVFIGVVCFVAICLVVMSIREARRKSEALDKTLSGPFDINMSINGIKYLDKGFGHALSAAIHKKAIFDFQSRYEMTTDVYGDPRPEFLEHESRLYNQYYGMVFQSYEVDGMFGSKKQIYYANPDFIEWLKSQKQPYETQDFVKAVVTYMRYIECEIRKEFGTDEDVYIDLDGHVINKDGVRLETIKEKEERFAKEEAERMAALMKSVQQVKSKKDTQTVKKRAVERYQACIAEIKNADGKGLMPEKPQTVPIALYQALYEQKVYGDQQIMRMMYDDRWDNLNEKGCYIIYNTCNEKSYVGKAENIYPDLKTYLDGVITDDNKLLREDMKAGHRILVKLVPLENSSYSSIDRLQNALIRAYAAKDPRGYNKPQSNT